MKEVFEMDRETARMIRREIRYRDAPSFAGIWIILGSIISFGSVGILGWLDRLLRTHKWIH